MKKKNDGDVATLIIEGCQYFKFLIWKPVVRYCKLESDILLAVRVNCGEEAFPVYNREMKQRYWISRFE